MKTQHFKPKGGLLGVIVRHRFDPKLVVSLEACPVLGGLLVAVQSIKIINTYEITAFQAPREGCWG